MIHFERQYRKLIQRIQATGYPSYPSKGPCREVIGAELTIMPEVVPLLTGRKMYPAGIIGELKAFLNNAQNNDDFIKHGCNFWGAWADQGVDYARLLFDFNGVNQLDKVINSIKNKPFSRKHIISLWDPSSKTLQPPCVMHYQWLISGRHLNMIWSQRSADVMIGVASDMFSAWLFNQLMARATNLEPGKVVMQIGSAHIYDKHDPEKYLKQSMHYAPVSLKIDFNSMQDWSVEILNYVSSKPVKYELCV